MACCCPGELGHRTVPHIALTAGEYRESPSGPTPRPMAAVESTIARLQRELARLKQQQLGTSRERFEPGPAQLALWGAEPPEAAEPELH